MDEVHVLVINDGDYTDVEVFDTKAQAKNRRFDLYLTKLEELGVKAPQGKPTPNWIDLDIEVKKHTHFEVDLQTAPIQREEKFLSNDELLRAGTITFRSSSLRKLTKTQLQWPADENPGVFFLAWVSQRNGLGFMRHSLDDLPHYIEVVRKDSEPPHIVKCTDWVAWFTSQAQHLKDTNPDAATVLLAAAHYYREGNTKMVETLLHKLSV